MYSMNIKIYLDKVLAIVMIFILFPLLIITTFLLFITQGSPILFVQMRTGKNMSKFKLYKFRTLVPSLLDELSMGNRKFTFFGKIMRKSGIDELPQLFNILKGDMSFVGPRPLPIVYEKKYNKVQLERFRVKPGITGWAQVHGKNNISWDRRFQLDLWYIGNLSLSIDFKICLMTVFQSFSSVLSLKKNQIEMPVFKGTKIL